jgi:signal transduction histidine kinase
MTNNLIDISKIESGRVEFNPTEWDVKTVVSETIKELDGYSADSTVELNIDVPDDLKVWADREKITQVLQNLLSNALKFTEVGEIAIRANKMSGAVQIDVEDTGIGIPPERLETIFDKFVPLDKSDGGRVNGSGLGLAICDSIIRKHHGTIAVKSQIGTGSCFSVMLPERVDLSLESQSVHGDTRELHTSGDEMYQILEIDHEVGNTN